MVALVNVDANFYLFIYLFILCNFYLFIYLLFIFFISDLTCHLEDTGKYFLVTLCCLLIRRPNFEVANEASPSAAKNTRVVLLPYHA